MRLTLGILTAILMLVGCNTSQSSKNQSGIFSSNEVSSGIVTSVTNLAAEELTKKEVVRFSPSDYPNDVSTPPGELAAFEYRALAVPVNFIDCLSAMDSDVFWTKVGDSFEGNTVFEFGSYEIRALTKKNASSIELANGNKSYRIFSANQPIANIYWIDTHTLVLKMIDGIYLDDQTHDYYSYDLSTGKVEEMTILYPDYERFGNFPYPSLTELHDYHVWYQGTHLFFGLSPQAEGPAQKHIFSKQDDGGYKVIAENVWSWIAYSGKIYYKNDASGNIYSVDLNGDNCSIEHNDKNPYGEIQMQEIQK